MAEEKVDLRCVEQQLRTARVKLGSALDLMDMAAPATTPNGDLYQCVLDIHADVDRLLEKMQLLAG